MAVNELVENDQIVSDLRDALRDGRSGLEYGPKLLRRVLEKDAWRKRFDSVSRSEVGFGTVAEFVTTPPTEGLGTTVELIDRIVGTNDPDLLRLWNSAKKVGQGHRSDLHKLPCDSQGSDDYGSGYSATRLALEAPEEYESVQRGEQSINAAAIRAGIRKPRMSVRLDSAESAAASLRKHMSAEIRRALAKLLLDD